MDLRKILGNYLEEQRHNTPFWKKFFYGALIVLVGLNLVIYTHHPHFSLEKIPGFWAVFGAVAAIILAKGAKGAAHTILGKHEDYYDD